MCSLSKKYFNVKFSVPDTKVYERLFLYHCVNHLSYTTHTLSRSSRIDCNYILCTEYILKVYCENFLGLEEQHRMRGKEKRDSEYLDAK
jgi:hypothetical protein